MKHHHLVCAIALCVAAAAPATARPAPCQPTGDVMRPCAVPLGPGLGATTPRLRDPVVRRGRLAGAAPAPAPVMSLGAGRVGLPGGPSTSVAGAATGPMQCVLDALASRGYPVRFIRGFGTGSVAGSLHPAGLAMDVNQTARGRTTPRMPSDEITIASSCGVISGAQWANNDSGHFQLGGYEGSARRRDHRYHHRHHHRR